MKAFQVTSFDQPPRVQDVAPPRPSPGQVALRIEACGVNFADTLMVSGRYQDTPEPPFTLGMEVCGTVIECGPAQDAQTAGVDAWADAGNTLHPGDRVIVFGGSGGMAEIGVFDSALCRKIPQSMPPEVAAGFQVAYGTSHLALTRRAKLGTGDRLLVLGAAGGVGLTAVEIGAKLGAEVIAVARGPEKLEIAGQAGATTLIEATDPDLGTTLKGLGGVDVLYDPVGGDLWRAGMRALRPEGRAITIGYASGDVPQIPANHLLVKNIDVIGFYWGAYLHFNPTALGNSLQELLRWYEEGHLTPHISHTIPLDQADQALCLLTERRSTGKIVVVPNS